MTFQLLCEGPICNAGHSALVRETEGLGVTRGATDAMRAAMADEVRGLVSRQLAVTPHVRAGVFRRGGIAFATFACKRCGHERVYGNSVTFQ